MTAYYWYTLALRSIGDEFSVCLILVIELQGTPNPNSYRSDSGQMVSSQPPAGWTARTFLVILSLQAARHTLMRTRTRNPGRLRRVAVCAGREVANPSIFHAISWVFDHVSVKRIRRTLTPHHALTRQRVKYRHKIGDLRVSFFSQNPWRVFLMPDFLNGWYWL